MKRYGKPYEDLADMVLSETAGLIFAAIVLLWAGWRLGCWLATLGGS